MGVGGLDSDRSAMHDTRQATVGSPACLTAKHSTKRSAVVSSSTARTAWDFARNLPLPSVSRSAPVVGSAGGREPWSGPPGRRRNVTPPDPLEHAFPMLDRARGQRPPGFQPRRPTTGRLDTVERGIPHVGGAVAFQTHDAVRSTAHRLAVAPMRLSQRGYGICLVCHRAPLTSRIDTPCDRPGHSRAIRARNR